MKLYIGAAVLLLMAFVNGQAIYTETWDDGELLAVSTGTDARGIVVTRTLSTIRGPGGIAAPTATGTGTGTGTRTLPATTTTTPLVPAVPTTTTTRAVIPPPVADEEDDPAPVEVTYTTFRGVQGETAQPPVQFTYTYRLPNQWCNLENDPTCSEVTWTATNSQGPTIATAIVPQGTQFAYTQYQSVVNSRVFGDAVEKQGTAAAQGAGGIPNAGSARYSSTVAGLAGAAWTVGMGVVVGVGMLVIRL